MNEPVNTELPLSNNGKYTTIINALGDVDKETNNPLTLNTESLQTVNSTPIDNTASYEEYDL